MYLIESSNLQRCQLLVPRVILKRWSSLEIDMYKNHLRDYSDSWGTTALVQSNETQNDLIDSSYEHEKKSIKKRKKKRRTSTRPYCRECRSYFRTLSCLQIHRKNCKKNPLEKQPSTMATKTTDPPEELESAESREDSPADLVESPSNKVAVREEDDSRYEYRPLVECNDCTTLFATSKQLLEHRQYLSCCPKKLALQQAELSDNTDEEYEYDVLYTCQVCRGKFVSQRLLELHTKREQHYRANEAYDNNDYSFDSLKHEKLGVDFYFRNCRDCDNEYSCSTCNNGFVYHDPDDLQKHQRAVHSAADGSYYCRYCAEKLSGPSDFNEHHRVHHELVRYCSVCSPGHDPRPDKLTKPLCQACCEKLGFGEYDCLKMLRENLYCDDCERSLPSLAHVRYHNCRSKSASLSEGLAPQLLVCPLCLTNYSGLRALYRHIVRHSDVAPYRCRDCGLLQKTWGQLCSHRRKSHQEEETKFIRWTTDELRRKADDVVKRFVGNGVQLLA
ncbi:unnamed protein product [Trichogramma brassicae]|uniref:C2H2-type domain-containing protein n=1 Tax=Trichogramma brassicae TaxID=86971 RepID=A0A6H5J4W3_9HYME|nr:unnamed protein product [Trichogramma brassicae]